MSALTLGAALGGVAEGYMRGRKITEEKAATRLNQLTTEQALQKNEFVLTKAREEDVKEKAATEIDAEIWKLKSTGDLSEFQDYFRKIKSPITVGSRMNPDKTIDIISSVDGSKLQTLSLPDFANSIYRPVAGKNHDLYDKAAADYAEKNKFAQEVSLKKMDIEGKLREKRTPQAENPGKAKREERDLSIKESNAKAYRDAVGKAGTDTTQPAPPDISGIFNKK